MTDYLLLIYPALFIFAVFYKSHRYAGSEFCPEIWGKSQTKMIQAAACIGVVLHHLTQEITSYGEIYHGPITIFSFVGILCTSLFFFFSGYGLVINGLNNPKYLDNFLLHRLTTVLVPFFAANIVFTCVILFYMNIPMSNKEIFQSLFGILLINGNGWYIVEIFFLYIAFYILFKLIKKKDVAIVILCLVTLWIIRTGYYGGRDSLGVGSHWFKGEWWYNSTIVFIMGMIVARFKDSIIAFLKKHYTVSLIVTAILFVISFAVEHHVLMTKGYYRESFAIDTISNKAVTLAAQMVLCLVFTALVLIIAMKLSIGNKVLGFIGTISMEMFLFHGLFVKYIFDYTYINSVLMYAIAIVCSVIVATVIHFVLAPIIKFITGLKKNKDYIELCERDLIRERKQKKTKRIKYVILIGGAAIILGFGGYKAYESKIKEPRECAAELESIKNAKVKDEVLFGRYETNPARPGKERLSWIVLANDGDTAMLITKEGITGSVYYAAHKEIGWKESDIHRLLNVDIYPGVFSASEKEIITENPDSGDFLSLLSTEEALKLFDGDVDRQLSLTEEALSEGTNINILSKANLWDEKGYRSSWWWLRGDEKGCLTAPIVTVDGTVEPEKKYVNKPNGAVRPVVFVKLH